MTKHKGELVKATIGVAIGLTAMAACIATDIIVDLKVKQAKATK